MKSIEFETKRGKTFISDLLKYNSVSCEIISYSGSRFDYELTLTIYISYKDYEKICVSQEKEYYFFKTEEDLINTYEKIKEILKQKESER